MALPDRIPDHIRRDTGLNVIYADKRSTGRRYNEYNEYYSSQENAKRFIKIGIEPKLHLLPQEIKLADFGSGDGFLTEAVIRYLETQGRTVHATAIDGSEKELKVAQKRGLRTEQGNLEELNYSEVFDLVIMRAVLHYNSYDAQSRIIDKIMQALKPNGIFINQLSSGDLPNVKLRNSLNHLLSLGRTKNYEYPHIITEQEYKDLCISKNFPTEFLDYAPPNYLTPESMFNRFKNKAITEKTKSRYILEQSKFKEQFLNVVSRYRSLTPDSIEEIDDTVRVSWKYPIFLSQKQQLNHTRVEQVRRLA